MSRAGGIQATGSLASLDGFIAIARRKAGAATLRMAAMMEPV